MIVIKRLNRNILKVQGLTWLFIL